MRTIVLLLVSSVAAKLRENVLDAADQAACNSAVGKGATLVAGGGWVHLISSCSAQPSTMTTIGTDQMVGDPVEGDVCFMKSSDDNGVSWDHFQVLTPGGLNSTSWGSCKGMYDTVRKQLLVQYSYYPTGASDQPANVTYFQITSQDDGATWSEPRDFTSELAPCNEDHPTSMVRGTAGNRIQLASGRLLWGGFGSNGATCVWYSDDGGESYTTSGLQNKKANEVSFVIADTTTGRLLKNGRKNGDDDARINYWSEDDGVTWSDGEPAVGFPDSVNSNNHGCMASLTNIDNKLFAFNPSPDGRTDMRVRCSLDHGTTWNATSPYYINGTSEGGYSDLIQVENDKGNILLLVWGNDAKDNYWTDHIDIGWCK